MTYGNSYVLTKKTTSYTLLVLTKKTTSYALLVNGCDGMERFHLIQFVVELLINKYYIRS